MSVHFTNAVLERIFVAGLDCQNLPLLEFLVRNELRNLGASPDPDAFIHTSFPAIGLTCAAREEMYGTLASPTSGARHEWLAIHEAGHAVVGLLSGLTLWGIRFFGDGTMVGQTGFPPDDWPNCADEAMLWGMIRTDVAANVAEFLMQKSVPKGGWPSQYFDYERPVAGGQYPSDIINAWKRALRLATVEFEREGRELDTDALWQRRREIVAKAEEEAAESLRPRLNALRRLAEQLRRGPMTGTAVRAILEETRSTER